MRCWRQRHVCDTREKTHIFYKLTARERVRYPLVLVCPLAPIPSRIACISRFTNLGISWLSRRLGSWFVNNFPVRPDNNVMTVPAHNARQLVQSVVTSVALLLSKAALPLAAALLLPLEHLTMAQAALFPMAVALL